MTVSDPAAPVRSADASSNPLERSFWFGTIDPRPLALFRIAIGLVVLHDLFDLTRDFRAVLTDDGMLPRSVPRDWFAWSVFDLTGSLPGVAAIYAVGVAAIVAFTIGLYTRAATAVAWVFLVSLHNRNDFMTDGGDTLVAILFFWSFFAELGASWSVDARRRGTAPARVPVFGLRIMQLHVAVLYLATARLKLARGWLHGLAIFQALQLVGFVRPLGGWLSTQPTLCMLSTWAILGMEAAFPLAAFSPVLVKPARAAALGLGLAIQLGIVTTMRVGIFQEAMLASSALFVLPEWFDPLQAWLQRLGVRARGLDPWGPRGLPEDAGPTPRWRYVLYGAMGLQFFVASWGFFGERRFPLPAVARAERELLAIAQPADLFGTVYAVPHWNAPGTLEDGSRIEVLSVAAPGTRPVEPGIQFSRWNKFTFKEREHPLPWPTLGPYLCRAYAERSPGPRLVSFDVENDEVPPRLPGDAPSPATPRALWHQDCP